MKLSENIKKIRKENHLSQEDLAEELNVTRQSVSKWESGLSYPEMDKILMICKKYNYKVDELINETTKETKESKNTVKNFVYDMLDWITKLISLFLRMTFMQKIKFITEQVIFILILGLSFLLLPSLFEYIFIEIIGCNLPIFIIMGNALSALLKITLLLLIIYIYYYLLNSRYIKYLNIDHSDEKKDNDKEVLINKVNIKTKDNPKIIIRDSSDSKNSIYSLIISLLSSLVKITFIVVLFFIIIIFILSIVAMVLIFPLISNILLFVSLFLILISIVIVALLLIITIYKFIVNIKINKKLVLIIPIMSLILFSLGLGLGITSIMNLEVIETEENYTESQSVEIKDLENINNILAYRATQITYEITNTDEVYIEISYPSYLNISTYNYISNYGNTFEIYSYIDVYSISFLYNDFYDNLKNNQIKYYSENYELMIYANEENLECIKGIMIDNN